MTPERPGIAMLSPADADPARALKRETEAAQRLLAYLREQNAADDEEVVASAIEGETGLNEAIAAVLADIDECDICIVGSAAKEAEYAERRRRKQARKDFLTAGLEQALLSAERSKIALSTATVFLSKRKPGLIVREEADIPSEFFVEQERPAPKLDKKAVLAAIEGGRTVPGVGLDNGSFNLSIRRK